MFPAQLNNGDARCVAEAASHEAGHTRNLSHDGQTGITEYHQGHVATTRTKDVVQWSKGEYTSANNLEDDTAIIAGTLGYRVDAAS